MATRQLGALGILAMLGGIFAPRPALADVSGEMSTSTIYSYQISHVPDFDQRRATLPNNGNAYCVPTAGTNWMAYFANHGRPAIDPGPGELAASKYTAASIALGLMGAYMGTNAQDGTKGSSAMTGIAAWVEDNPFLITLFYSDFDWSPDFQQASMQVLSGGYVMPFVGWYDEDNLPCILRHGGHALSLVRGSRYHDSMVIGWHDPAADDGLPTAQSPFATESYSIVDKYVIPGCDRLPRHMSRVSQYGNDSVNGYIDALLVIRPLFVLVSQPDMIHWSPVRAIRLWGDLDLPAAFGTGFTTELVDLVASPDLLSHYYVAKAPNPTAPNQLWRLDAVLGASTLVDIPLAQPSRLVFGRRRDLYVVDGAQLACLNVDIPQPAEINRITPAFPVDAIAYDDANDQVVLLSNGARRITRYPWHLQGNPVNQSIPAGVPIGGRSSIAWTPDGGLWVTSDSSNALLRLVTDPNNGRLIAAAVSDPDLVAPRAVDVSDDGRVFVSTQGRVLEFVEGPPSVWTRAPNPFFPDLEAGDVLRVARSRTNYDPAEHGTPEWRNVLPDGHGESEPECPADLDQNGAVDFGDLLRVLAAWGPCPPDTFCDEDLDYGHVVDFNDLLALLSAWGPCP